MSHSFIVRPGRLHLGHVLELVDMVPSIQSGPDLLVSLDEALEFDVEISVLTLQSAAVSIQSIDLSLHIIVTFNKVAVIEPQVVLLLPGSCQLVISRSQHVLSLEYLSIQVTVSAILRFCLSGEVLLVCELAIQISLKCMNLSVQSGMIVLCTCELSIGGIECLASTP